MSQSLSMEPGPVPSRVSLSVPLPRPVPRWRAFVVQWDISHNALTLAFFAFTAMFQSASLHLGDFQVPAAIWYTLYLVSSLTLVVNVVLFLTRAVIYPSAIAHDFQHPRLINFFFLPVMIGALCILTTPPFLRSLVQFRLGFYVIAAYQLILALYLYGEWLFGRQPTNFIHPLVFMQTIGYFLLANIGATAHLIDQAYAMVSIGLLFWLLVFITNFQHLSPALNKHAENPQPTFFLFIAPPAQAALAIVVLSIADQPRVDTSTLLAVTFPTRWPRLAECLLYIDLFLYLLMFRLFPTFWRIKFSVTWWAYIFPLSAAASSVIGNFRASGNLFWAVVAAVLSSVACIAMVTVSGCMVWGLVKGKTPNNPNILEAYRTWYYRDEFVEDGRIDPYDSS